MDPTVNPSDHTRGPRRVGGSVSFTTAHSIAADPSVGVDFAAAFALSRLVIDFLGGPVVYTGRKAVIDRKVVSGLHKCGLVELQGEAEYNLAMYRKLSVDQRLVELIQRTHGENRFVALVGGRERPKWKAAATQEGFDVVASHLPDAASR